MVRWVPAAPIFRRPLKLSHEETFIYTAYGPTVNTRNNEEERAVLSQFLWEKLPGLVSGGLKPNVIRRFDGGLDNIEAALDYLAQGKASGEKVVYSI